MQQPSMQHFPDAKDAGDDWTAITARGERKKRQNRLNQRALRFRKGREGSKVTSGRMPNQIEGWRIESCSAYYKSLSSSLTLSSPNQSSPEHADSHIIRDDIHTPKCSVNGPGSGPVTRLAGENNICPLILQRARYQKSKELLPSDFPFSGDHLLHLIHHNVFRALAFNRCLLTERTFLTKSEIPSPILALPSDECLGFTIIHPLSDKALPHSLHPTQLQTTFPHSAWLNTFPFPRFRDNLIEWEGVFDSNDLCHDLLGELFTNSNAMCSDTSISVPSVSSRSERTNTDFEDDVAASRRGLIVWGEPWDTKGWEVTPGFVRKWGWLLQGCEELIELSNFWRAKRNETPLQLEVLVV